MISTTSRGWSIDPKAETRQPLVQPFLTRQPYARWKTPDVPSLPLPWRFQSFPGRAFLQPKLPWALGAAPPGAPVQNLACRCAVRADESWISYADARIQ